MSRTQKNEAAVLASFSKGGVLAQKSVTRMNRGRSGIMRRFEDCRLVQVALGCRWKPEQDGLIRFRNMGRVAVRFRVDRNRRHTEFAQRADNAAGNDAAVGDQDFFKHAARSVRRIPNEYANGRGVVRVTRVI